MFQLAGRQESVLIAKGPVKVQNQRIASRRGIAGRQVNVDVSPLTQDWRVHSIVASVVPRELDDLSMDLAIQAGDAHELLLLPGGLLGGSWQAQVDGGGQESDKRESHAFNIQVTADGKGSTAVMDSRPTSTEHIGYYRCFRLSRFGHFLRHSPLARPLKIR